MGWASKGDAGGVDEGSDGHDIMQMQRRAGRVGGLQGGQVSLPGERGVGNAAMRSVRADANR
jgi:hypothetical protein